MSKINKILVPVDGSDNACKAVDQAISLAEKAGASLEFVYVSSHINEHIPSDIIFDRIWEKLPKDIIRVAQETNSDIIIMGSRGLGIFKGALIGSVSQKVIEDSPVPVMVVK